MLHPLYYRACRLVGQPIYAQHMNGQLYQGTLMSTTPHGIYMMPHGRGARLMSTTNANSASSHTVSVAQNPTQDLQLAYSPGAYFAFGALTGLTAAALFSPWWW